MSLVGHTMDGNLVTFGGHVLKTYRGWVPNTSLYKTVLNAGTICVKVQEDILDALSSTATCEVLVPCAGQCLMLLKSLRHSYHEVEGGREDGEQGGEGERRSFRAFRPFWGLIQK